MVYFLLANAAVKKQNKKQMKNVAHNTRMMTSQFDILDNNTTLILIKTTSGAVVFYTDSETTKFFPKKYPTQRPMKSFQPNNEPAGKKSRGVE